VTVYGRSQGGNGGSKSPCPASISRVGCGSATQVGSKLEAGTLGEQVSPSWQSKQPELG
jgi:hypothetical protein